jgi:sugar lactone lactonase YvrE
VWVADSGNDLIRKVTSAGVVSFVAGGAATFADGAGATANFNQPNGITVDDSGNVFVADTSNNRIRKIVAGTSTVSTLVGGGSGGQTLSSPQSVACDRSGNLYIADTGNFRILRVASGSNSASVFAGSGVAGISDGNGAAAQFISPSSVTVDFAGNVYVGDASFVRRVSSSGAVTSLTINDVNFVQPRITTDRQADGSIIYATDGDNNTVYTIKRDISNNYNATLLAGTNQGFLDGVGAAARFQIPLQPFVTGDGTLYVPDQQNNCIRKLQ